MRAKSAPARSVGAGLVTDVDRRDHALVADRTEVELVVADRRRVEAHHVVRVDHRRSLGDRRVERAGEEIAGIESDHRIARGAHLCELIGERNEPPRGDARVVDLHVVGRELTVEIVPCGDRDAARRGGLTRRRGGGRCAGDGRDGLGLACHQHAAERGPENLSHAPRTLLRLG